MKNIVIAIITIFGINTMCAQEKPADCKSMQTGTFEYMVEGLEHVKIVRTANKQVETNAKTGGSITGTVKWLSDCEYELTFDKVTEKGAEAMVGKKIRTTITAVDGDVVSLHVTADEGEGDLQMKKIK